MAGQSRNGGDAAVPIESASEKMPFEIAPVYLHLTYWKQHADQVAETKPVTPDGN